ncbi:hypothetical protein [Armatimonas sp.]|uniref:hypothetical protein n=1 Tax=Armatimonas sp. TaxID=1872638 RepID=UPI00374CB52F
MYEPQSLFVVVKPQLTATRESIHSQSKMWDFQLRKHRFREPPGTLFVLVGKKDHEFFDFLSVLHFHS